VVGVMGCLLLFVVLSPSLYPGRLMEGVDLIDRDLLVVLGYLMWEMVVLLLLVWILIVIRPMLVDLARDMREVLPRVYRLVLLPIDLLEPRDLKRKRRRLQLELEPFDFLQSHQ
jgi:hypothetical protein